jgi:hypothetical protein
VSAVNPDSVGEFRVADGERYQRSCTRLMIARPMHRPAEGPASLSKAE